MTPEADPNPLITLLRQCIVQIQDGGGRLRGTGFFVAPGRVVTCAHVVHGASAIQVMWQGQEVSAAVAGAVPSLDTVASPAAYPLPDLALLDVGEAAQEWDHPCVRLWAGTPALDRSPDVLYLAGYTIEHTADTPALTGATTEFESAITEDQHTFYKLKRGQVLPGFSGSPLLNLRTGSVTGIVESSRGRHADLGGFGVPAEGLASAFPGLLAANQGFHQDDDRWTAAVEAERTRSAERDGARVRLALRPPVVPLLKTKTCRRPKCCGRVMRWSVMWAVSSCSVIWTAGANGNQRPGTPSSCGL